MPGFKEYYMRKRNEMKCREEQMTTFIDVYDPNIQK